MRGRVLATVVAAVAVIAGAGGAALASTLVTSPSAGGEISACFLKRNGAVRLVNAGARCRAGERALVWNVAGPAGAPGAAGAVGAPGPAGPAGTPGPAGSIAGAAAGGALTGSYPNPTLAANEAPHVVGAVGEPAYLNSFIPYVHPDYSPAAFAIDRAGTVHLSGLVCYRQSIGTACLAGSVTGGPPIAIFSLPAGYRPAKTRLFSTWTNAVGVYVAGRIDIAPNGVVSITGIPSFGGSWISLDGISFQAGM
jgi:hypothetical protein